MKVFTFKLVIEEGSDEFWEGLTETGCDQVRERIKNLLDQEGWLEHGELTLVKFEDTGEVWHG